MENTKRFAPALGRLFIAFLFLGSGIGKVTNPAGGLAMIEHAGLPFPVLALWGAAVVEIVGGLFLLVGYRTRLAAAALGIFTVLAALFFHNNFADTNQMIHFLKNFAIVGGLLQICTFGAGGLSLDSRKGAAQAA